MKRKTLVIDAINEIIRRDNEDHYYDYDDAILNHIKLIMEIYRSDLTDDQFEFCLYGQYGFLDFQTGTGTIFEGIKYGLTMDQIKSYARLAIENELLINDIIDDFTVYGLNEDQIKSYISIKDRELRNVVHDAYAHGLSIEQVKPLITEDWTETHALIYDKYNIDVYEWDD